MSDNPYRAILEGRPASAVPPPQPASDNPYRAILEGRRPAPPPPEEEEGRGVLGTMREVGRGIVAAPVTLGQGIVELGAAGVDLAFDTDYARQFSEAAADFRARRGLQTDTVPARVAEEIVAFGLGFVPFAGWLGRASSVARGAAPVAGASRNLFMRTAEEFGRSARGRALLGTRARLAATTAVGAGGFEFITTPDGYGTVSDTFDVMPEFLRTEDADEFVTGRDDALRRFRNRGRRAAEAAAMSAAVDTAFALAPRAAEAAVSLPVIGPAISGTARATQTAFRTAASAAGRLPGAQSTTQFFQRWFSPTGGIDPRIAEANFDRQAFSATERRAALDHLARLDEALNRQFGVLGIRGRGRGGVERAYSDVRRYLEGEWEALDAYSPAVREAADGMQSAIYGLQNQLLDQIDDQIDLVKQRNHMLDLGETSGLRQLQRTREEIVQQRNAAAEARKALNAARQGAAQAIGGVEDSVAAYIRRRFELYEAPERFYRQLDPKFMDSPEFSDAVTEVLYHTGAVRGTSRSGAGQPLAPTMDEARSLVAAYKNNRGALGRDELAAVDIARRDVLRYLGLDMLADPNINVSNALKARAKAAAQARLGKEVFPRASGINVIESLFDLREPLLDQSPALRGLMGEVTDARLLFVHTISDLADTVSNIRFANSMIDGKHVQGGSEALASLSNGGRPMLVDPGFARREAGLPEIPGVPSRTAFVSEDMEDVVRTLEGYGYRQLGEGADPTHPFMGAYGSLTGLWAPVEMHDALNVFGRLGQTNTSEIVAIGVGAKALSQQATVVLNPVSQIRAFLGNTFFLAGNGNLGRNLSAFDSLRLTAASLADMGDEAAKVSRELGQLGVVDTALGTSQIQELQRMGKDLNWAGRFQQAVDKVLYHIPVVGNLNRLLNSSYSNVDTLFKIANTLAEESKFATTLARAGLRDTDQAVRSAMIENGLAVRAVVEQNPSIPFGRVYAAGVTKDVMATYNRVPRAVKALDMTPFFSAFASFASETIRNSANTLVRGMRELGFTVSPTVRQQMGEEAARRLETGMRAQGLSRLTSFLTVSAVSPDSAMLASARAVGMTEEDVAAAYQMLPPYTGGHALIFSGFDRSTGQVEYVDQSLTNPYAFTTDGVRAALRAYERAGVLNASTQEQILRGVWAGLVSYVEPFGTESLVFERLRDVLPLSWVGRGGQTPTGARIYGESESVGSQLSKSFNHILGGFLPGYIREFSQPRQGEWESGRLTRAMRNIPSAQGQDFSIPEEAARLVTGFTPMTINLRRDFHFNGLEYTALRSEARGTANRAIRDADTTPEQMIERWSTYLDDVYRHQSALYADVLAARQLGMSEREIIQTLRQRANMGAAEAGSIVRGQFYVNGPSADLMRDIRRDGREDLRTRRTPEPPWREFQRLTRERSRQPLSPQLGIEAREQGQTSMLDLLRSRMAPEAAPAPAAPPASVAMAPAPPAPPAAPAPAAPTAPIPPAPAAPATRAATPSPGLLGSNPMDILRNMEVAQRTAGG